ncbi:efflux RND transporter periplasmic adaptor subunit [Halopseudomonas bauzanensis]|uniref:Efflux RND transporter periplasmic adaptor subunit n=1 Tax=Halopseudomonas bauzanensis TaxID=653930 RepID=A0A4U0YVX1_9GAMM|nr:efflux RND transporter periplasmic adaptor subunit [Halopseudomonas bauzanensis]TKA93253.1 efflux RND transporter periplasmic adaptor subunit [Halopseudomonas bauzanensis]
MCKSRMSAVGVVLLFGLLGCGGTEEPEVQQNGQSATAGQQGGEAQLVSVKAVPVEHRNLQTWVYSQGTARSRQREFLTFTQQGMVSHVDEELRVGSPVKAGQLIAHQAPERVQADLQAAKAALAEAEANLELAKVTRRRYEALIEQRSASRQELDQAVVQVEQATAARDNSRAQLAQAQLTVDESRLVSPIDGVLARLNIEKGRYFMPSVVQTNTEQNALRTVPALVIGPNRFEVRVDLPSYDFRQVENGARAVIGGEPPRDGRDVDPLVGNDRVAGTVHAISPSLDPETRTFEVVVHTEGDNPGLLDGEFVAVWIALPVLQESLAVPLEALRFRNDQSFVFVVERDSGRVNERRVELGQQAGAYRAVVEGIAEGELVVTDGRAALYDGQQVRVLQADGERE